MGVHASAHALAATAATAAVDDVAIERSRRANVR
jgi:hypothetical protein